MSTPFFHITRIVLIVCYASFGWTATALEKPTSWEPQRTWVFGIGCTVWKHDRSMNMPKKGREDTELMETFKARGVPDDHVVFLKDKEGTLEQIQSSFKKLLKRTKSGDMLIFYFQGHGSRDLDGRKSTYYFCNYDCDDDDEDSFLYVKDVYDMIETYFHGNRALMLADCCMSGGMAIVARTRHTNIAYACLNSTYAHDSSSGGWTYTDALARGFRGDPVVDLNANGTVDLGELADYTGQRMAFVETQKSVFTTFNGFDEHMRIAAPDHVLKLPMSRFVEAKWDDGYWYKAEIMEEKDGKYHVVCTDDGDELWVSPKKIREWEAKQYEVGTLVMARCEEDDDKWRPGRVVRAWYGLHYVHFEDDPRGTKSAWESPDRIRLRKK
jgi:hypothetical protein